MSLQVFWNGKVHAHLSGTRARLLDRGGMRIITCNRGGQSETIPEFVDRMRYAILKSVTSPGWYSGCFKGFKVHAELRYKGHHTATTLKVDPHNTMNLSSRDYWCRVLH